MKQPIPTLPPNEKKGWVAPSLIVYGDMTVITQQTCNLPTCKPKVLGSGDDFSSNISTLG